MNPYDKPSYLTVKKCLKYWGTENFDDEFLSELSENESKLPLENMCRNGGSPSVEDNAELEDLKIGEESNGVVKGSFHVSFTEESPTGCRDMQWKNPVSGKIEFSLDLETGEIEFEPPQLDKRQYEPDEF